MACCQDVSRNCCVVAVMFTGILCLIFHIMLIAMIDLKLTKESQIKELIFSETPIYDLSFSSILPTSEKIYIKSFFEFQGREKEILTNNGRTTRTSSTSKQIFSKNNITKIYNNYFIYNKDKRTYFDYNKDYTVAEGENCKENYKKCGIFNSLGRILCLPNDEECPLNDFYISSNSDDVNYAGYEKMIVSDFSSLQIYYIYYTNKKTDNNIITNFKLSNGYPCIDSSETSWISVFNDEVEKNPRCKTIINDKLTDDRYKKVSESGISLKTLYHENNIPISDADTTKIESTVDLYVRNFFDKNEECINDFFSDFKDENKRLDSTKLIVRILYIISAVLLCSLVVYTGLNCCFFDLHIYLFFIIVHIYGIIIYIVTLVLILKKHLKYNCDDIGFNNLVNKILNKNYSNNQGLVIGLGAMMIFMYILNLIFTICLKYNKNRVGIHNNDFGVQPKVPLSFQGFPQAVYIQQQSQINNIGYATPYTPYYINQQINNKNNPITTPVPMYTPTPYISNQVINNEIKTSSNQVNIQNNSQI